MPADFEKNSIKPKERQKKWSFWLFVALLLALLLSNLAGETIKNMFFSLLGGLTPVILAMVLAFLLLSPIRWIEDKLLKNAFVGNPRARLYKRLISLSVCYSLIIGLVLLLLFTVLPYIINTLQDLASDSTLVPRIKSELTSLITSITGFSTEEVTEFIQPTINGIGEALTEWLASLGANLGNIVTVVGNVAFASFMGLIISLLMLKDKELIASTARRCTYAYNTKKKADEIVAVTRRSKNMLNQFLIANIITMCIIFVVTWVGYAIIGVPFAPLLALALAILSIIPYLGGFIAMVPVILVTLVFGSVTLMLTAIIFGLATWAIITTIIPPFITSKRLQTRAIVMFMALVIGGALFGIWGMILAAPVASVVMIILQERLEVREAQREREELMDAGIVDVPTSGISDMLDLKEDIDPVIQEMKVQEFERKIMVKPKIKKQKEKKDEKDTF